jgi:hypothetical protein
MDLDNFIIGKTKERRGKERVGKKSSSCCHMVGRPLQIHQATVVYQNN